MADDAPKRPRGRPRLKAGEESVHVHLRCTVTEYAAATRIALKRGSSVAGVFRRAFLLVTKQPHRLDEP